MVKIKILIGLSIAIFSNSSLGSSVAKIGTICVQHMSPVALKAMVAANPQLAQTFGRIWFGGGERTFSSKSREALTLDSKGKGENVARLKSNKPWAETILTLDFFHDQRAISNFKKIFLSPGSVEKIVAQRGKISYPSKFANDNIKEYAIGTPLQFAIQYFGNLRPKGYFESHVDKSALAKFRSLPQPDVHEVQYNLTQSLINAGADVHMKIPGMGCKFGSGSRDDWSVSRSPLNKGVLSDALYNYNVGATQALIEAGVNVNEVADQVITYKKGQGHPKIVDYYLLDKLIDPKNGSFDSSKEEDLTRIEANYVQLVNLLEAAAAKRVGESRIYTGKADFFAWAFGASDDSFTDDQQTGSYDHNPSHNGQAYCKLFEQLNLGQSSNVDEVAKAYKQKIAKIHPDRFEVGTKEYFDATQEAAALNDLYDQYKQDLK